MSGSKSDFTCGVLLTLAAAVFWGSMSVAAQFVMASKALSPLALVVVRLCVSGGLLFFWCLLRQRSETVRLFASALNVRDVLFAAFFIFFGQFAFMQAIDKSNAGAAAIVLTTVPLWVALWQAITLHRSPAARVIVCFALAVTGVAMIVTKGDFNAVDFNAQGLCWALACAVASAAYSVQPRALLRRAAVLPVMGGAMFAGGLMAAVSAVFFGASFSAAAFEPATLSFLGYVVFVGTLLAFCCYMAAIRLISPVIVGILSCAEPVTAYVLSVTVAGLEVGRAELCGIVLVLASVVILACFPNEGATGENVAGRWKQKAASDRRP